MVGILQTILNAFLNENDHNFNNMLSKYVPSDDI